ncbi:serine hydrolase domain-containing protein [Georgenia subflava]|nr:serine hydrolase [Georgenia subflava]
MRELRAAAALLLLLTACASAAEPDGDTTTGVETLAPSPDETATPPTGSDALAAAVEDRFVNDPSDRGYEDVRAFLVVAGGEPLVERYDDATPETGHNVFSVTKSVTSVLVGIALAEGHLTSVDQTLSELLPEHAPDMEPELAGVTLEQLLTMTSGLPLSFPRVTAENDVVAAIVERGLTGPAGEQFFYSDAGVHLLSAILTRATGMSAMQFAREHLFDPLGACAGPAPEPLALAEDQTSYDEASCAWPVDAQGHNIGSWGLKLIPEDMVKIGRLMLDGGAWEGEQVVPAEWVARSTEAHVDVRGAPDYMPSYGYLWWVTTAGGHDGFAALGYGGQMIEVVPALELVVVASTTVPERPNMEPAFLVYVVDRDIAPALEP